MISHLKSDYLCVVVDFSGLSRGAEGTALGTEKSTTYEIK